MWKVSGTQASAIGCLPRMGFEVQSPLGAVDLRVHRGVSRGETLKDGSWACGDLHGPLPVPFPLRCHQGAVAQ